MNLAKYPIKEVNFEDKNYPAGLKELKKPPKKLFYRGNIDQKLFEKSLAIVGTRRATQYGRQVTEKLTAALVTAKVTIISGFMYGIDTEAHRQCLEYGGRTVAALGSGLNIIYPPENEALYEQILAKKGAIMAEYPADTQPQLWTFPQRNRLVAALASLGVLIIEAGAKSGSLITSRLARQLGRKIFAVPGPITAATSIGTNLLIKTHQAKMVTEVTDILGGKIESPNLFADQKLTGLEAKISQLLASEPLMADELVKATGENIVNVSKTLSLMSLKGLIEEVSGKFYLARATLRTSSS